MRCAYRGRTGALRGSLKGFGRPHDDASKAPVRRAHEGTASFGNLPCSRYAIELMSVGANTQIGLSSSAGISFESSKITDTLNQSEIATTAAKVDLCFLKLSRTGAARDDIVRKGFFFGKLLRRANANKKSFAEWRAYSATRPANPNAFRVSLPNKIAPKQNT